MGATASRIACAGLGAILAGVLASGPVHAGEADGLGNGSSRETMIDQSGRYVVFASDATNLVGGDANRRSDIFWADLETGAIRLVSRGVGGAGANGASSAPRVSSGGRFVAFTSMASNLVAGDTNGKLDVFRADLKTGEILRVSLSSTGQAPGTWPSVDMSADGSKVVFVTWAPLVPQDRNGLPDVYLRDLPAGTTRLISVTPQGNQFVRPSTKPSISPNGQFVGFAATIGLHEGIFGWSAATGRTELVFDGGAFYSCLTPLASNAGVSYVGNLDYGDHYSTTAGRVAATPSTNSFSFVRDNSTWLTDVSTNGGRALISDGYGSSVIGKRTHMLYDPPNSIYPLNGQSISGDGRLVVGVAQERDAPTNYYDQVMLWNVETDDLTTVTRASASR